MTQEYYIHHDSHIHILNVCNNSDNRLRSDNKSNFFFLSFFPNNYSSILYISALNVWISLVKKTNIWIFPKTAATKRDIIIIIILFSVFFFSSFFVCLFSFFRSMTNGGWGMTGWHVKSSKLSQVTSHASWHDKVTAHEVLSCSWHDMKDRPWH